MWLVGRVPWIALIYFTALPLTLYYGWYVAEPSAPLYGRNPTHLWGLKFMPPCEPFGVDASCGVDFLFILPVVLGFFAALFDVLGFFTFKKEEVEDERPPSD